VREESLILFSISVADYWQLVNFVGARRKAAA